MPATPPPAAVSSPRRLGRLASPVRTGSSLASMLVVSFWACPSHMMIHPIPRPTGEVAVPHHAPVAADATAPRGAGSVSGGVSEGLHHRVGVGGVENGRSR